MNNLENNHIVELINEILEMLGDEMPKDVTLKLVDYLQVLTLVSPVDEKGNIMKLVLGSRTFIPASCDVENLKYIFKDIDYDFF